MSFKRLLFILPLFGLVAFFSADGHGVQQFDRFLAQIKERAGLATGVAATSTPARTAPAIIVNPGSLYVYDGDTIIIDDQRMRILDIDTPEISVPRCDAEAQRGIEARNRLRSLVDRSLDRRDRRQRPARQIRPTSHPSHHRWQGRRPDLNQRRPRRGVEIRSSGVE